MQWSGTNTIYGDTICSATVRRGSGVGRPLPLLMSQAHRITLQSRFSHSVCNLPGRMLDC